MSSVDLHDFEPSAYGFRSIRARTRQERRALQDKVAIEKGRINQRVGFQARMQRENAPETSAGLTTCVVGGAGYLSNADRFHSDTAGEELAHRQQTVVRKQQAIEYRRNQSLEREDNRWRRIEEKQQQDAEKWNRLRESGTKSGKNQSSAAYDITNLQYHENDDGKQQKYVDDMGTWLIDDALNVVVRYRAQLRTRDLVVQGDSRVSYNIISGDDRSLPKVPEPVAKPELKHGGKVDMRRGF